MRREDFFNRTLRREPPVPPTPTPTPEPTFEQLRIAAEKRRAASQTTFQEQSRRSLGAPGTFLGATRENWEKFMEFLQRPPVR